MHDAGAFVEYLFQHGYPQSGQLLSILGRYIPVPPRARHHAAAVLPEHQLLPVDSVRAAEPALHSAVGAQLPAGEDGRRAVDRVVEPTLAAARCSTSTRT